MSKEYTIEASFHILTSIHSDNEKDAKIRAKKLLHETADFIRPYCDCVDIELENVDCYDEEV